MSPPPPRHRWLRPESEAELADLIRRAGAAGRRVRVIGAGHSTTAAILGDRAEDVPVSLERLNRVLAWDEARVRVTVQAGCHLGVDPFSPHATVEHSFLRQLDARGWALADLGGITHQTVGGFVSTGSAGGSLAFSVADGVCGIRLVDGRGQIHELAPNLEDPDDAEHNPFFAAGVSMGLLGVITAVSFQCEPRYEVIGDSVTADVDALPLDPFADGEGGLVAHLRAHPYARLFWWPRPGVDRVQSWTARRATDADRGQTHPDGVLRPKLHAQLPFGRAGQLAVREIMRFANARPRPIAPWRRATMVQLSRLIIAPEAKAFWGPWLDVLPMDDEIHYDLLPCAFTELFVPLDRAVEAMQTLRTHFAADRGYERAGTFAVELYAGKQSPFWMSPAYGQDAFRIDGIEILTGDQRPERDFFPQLWSALSAFDVRYHWGKHMPPPQGPEAFRDKYPKWDAFLSLRREMDPNDVFLTDYWRHHLLEAPPEITMNEPQLSRRQEIAAEPRYRSTHWWAQLNFWGQIGGNLFGVFWAHSWLVGLPWDLDPGHPGAVAVSHAVAVPAVGMLLFTGWYGAFRARPRRANRLRRYVQFSFVGLAVFLLFEVLKAQQIMASGGPSWQVGVLYAIVGVMVVGLALLFILHGKLERYLEDED